MSITCLTCTGDRPLQLARSRFYLERASCNVEWVVVDDGLVPFNPGGCTYLRREPDGPASLGRNLLYGLATIKSDYILIWEDDDWYAPTRIKKQLAYLYKCTLHSWCETRYYNIPYRRHFNCRNYKHGSLFETGFTRDFLPIFIELIRTNNTVFLDLLIWRKYRELGTLSIFDKQCVGIKGLGGRQGLGSGHRLHNHYYHDVSGQALKNLIGETDAEWYFSQTWS